MFFNKIYCRHKCKKMLLPKTVAILTINEDFLNGKMPDMNSNYLARNLSVLGYDVEKIVVIRLQENVIFYEVTNLLMQYDIVIILGGIGSVLNDVTCQTVAKIFNTGVVFNEILASYLNITKDSLYLKSAYIPAHAKLLEYHSNNCVKFSPIVYMQNLFIMTTCNADLLHSSFKNILAPFLINCRRKIELQLVLQIDVKDWKAVLEDLKRTVKDGVRYEACGNTFQISAVSSDLSSLLYFEEIVKSKCSHDVCIVYKKDDNIGSQVYSRSECHIRKAIECIEECFSKYGPENVFISFNGGKDCTVLLHLMLGVLKKNYPHYQKSVFCMYVQSTNSFPDIETFISACKRYYGLDILTIARGIKESLAFILKLRPNLKACLMGTRRTDPFSATLQTFQLTDSGWPQVMRVSPLLDWHYSDIWDYLLSLKVPYCQLYDIGYTSLGSTTNTRKNPSLCFYDVIKGQEVYLPAFKLLDASQERNGRIT